MKINEHQSNAFKFLLILSEMTAEASLDVGDCAVHDHAEAWQQMQHDMLTAHAAVLALYSIQPGSQHAGK